MRGLAAIKMSLRQYFRLLLDYRDIWIYPFECTMACTLMETNYSVVIVLPSRQINAVSFRARGLCLCAEIHPTGTYHSVRGLRLTLKNNHFARLSNQRAYKQCKVG